MKKKLYVIGGILLLCASLAVIFAGCGSKNQTQTQSTQQQGNQQSGTQQGGVTVSMKNTAFNPKTLTVTKGTTVTWVNDDPVAHDVTGADFQSGSIGKGGSYSHTFDTVGTFNYRCTVHPGMDGTITVTE